MPRGCSICESRARAAVDADLIAGRSVRDVAASHSLGYQAVNRHRLNHLPAAIRRAAREAMEREDAAQAASNPSQVEDAAPIVAARPAPPMAVPVPSPVAPSTGRTRRRGLELDPSAPAAPDATVAPGPLSTSIGADRTAPGPAGPLDLHAAIIGLQSRALTILAQAEADGDAKTALVAIRETRGVLETLARLQERQGTAGATIPLEQSQEWVRTRSAIVAALADFPDARLAVAEALISTGAVS